jgi:hypothetical protein
MAIRVVVADDAKVMRETRKFYLIKQSLGQNSSQRFFGFAIRIDTPSTN